MEEVDLARHIPSWDQLQRFAPTTLLILSIHFLGLVLGWWARGAEVKTLREWLDEIRRK